MRVFKNYGVSHVLATLIATTLIALIPFGYPLVFHTQMDFQSTAFGLAGLCYLVMAVVGVPTELWLCAKFAEPSLGRAYLTYAASGLAASMLAGGLFMATNQMSGAWQYALLMAGVFYLLYLPIMLIARGVFVPIERALRKVIPLRSTAIHIKKEETDVLH